MPTAGRLHITEMEDKQKTSGVVMLYSRDDAPSNISYRFRCLARQVC